MRGQLFFDELLEELFRYLFLLARHPDSDVVPISPSEVVNQALHVLLLTPRLYLRVCDALLKLLGDDRVMRALPHVTDAGVDREEQNGRYARTLLEYTVIFRHVPLAPVWKALNPQAPTLNEHGQIRIEYHAKHNGPLLFDVNFAMTIGDVKLLMRDKTGMPPLHQKFIHNGRYLLNNRTLRDCGVKPNDLVYCIPC